jgi:hypothetical protein
MPGYEQVHTGDIVLGHDQQEWGVAEIQHAPHLAVTLVRYGARITGYPPAGTPVTVITPAAMDAEAAAWQVLTDAGLGPVEILGERWTG